MKREQLKTVVGLLQLGAQGLQITNDEHEYFLQAFDILRHAADEPDAKLDFATDWR